MNRFLLIYLILICNQFNIGKYKLYNEYNKYCLFVIVNEYIYFSKFVISKRFDFCELFGGILFKFLNLK